MNLATNASRALENAERKELAITAAAVDNGRIEVRFSNSGPPIAEPENLFKPFESGSSGRGLGLYVARAILRSFGGDLSYEPVKAGCCFAVTLQRAELWYMYDRANDRQKNSHPAH